MKSFSSIIIFLLFGFGATAQSFSFISAGNDSCLWGYGTSDNDHGFLFTGDGWQNGGTELTRLDSNLNIDWQLLLPPFGNSQQIITNIEKSANGSVYLFFENLPWVVNVSSAGTINWAFNYQDTANHSPLYGNWIADSDLLPGNRLVLAGTAKTGTANLWRSWLQVIDSTGAIAWSYNYAFGNQWEGFHAVTASLDSGITAIGNVKDTAGRLTLAHFSAGGNLLWSRLYAMPGYPDFHINRLIQADDSSYIACGNTIFNADGLFVKFDKNGNLLWSKVYGSLYNDDFAGLVEDQQGYVVSGYVKAQPNCIANGALFCLDKTDGTITWEHYVGEGFIWQGHPVSFASLEKYASGFLAGGYTGLNEPNFFFKNPAVFFFGASGEYACNNVNYTIPSVAHTPFAALPPIVQTLPGNSFSSAVAVNCTSPGISLNMGCLNTLSEPVTEESSMVYPNPSGGIFTLPVNAGAEITVCTVLGKVVFQTSILQSPAAIDLSGEAGGVYFMTVKTEKGTTVQRLILKR